MEEGILERHIQEILNEFQEKYKVVISHVFVHHSKDNSIDKISLNIESIAEWKRMYGGK